LFSGAAVRSGGVTVVIVFPAHVFGLPDFIAYVVFTGFEFAALCAMTRLGHGWIWQLLGLGVLVGVDVLLE